MNSTSNLPLAGKVALVTGAGRNVGKAIALAYARAGADVVVNVRSNREDADLVVDEIRAMGRRAFSGVADISSQAAVETMVAAARAELGPITVLACCAGARSTANIRDLPAEELNRALGTNVLGPFHAIKAVVEDMVSAGSGRIVALSGDGPHLGMPSMAHVYASKFGLEGLIRGAAVDLGQYGITANIVSPHMVGSTDITHHTEAENARRRSLSAGIIAQTPIGRLVNGDELAALVLFLSLPETGFLSRQVIHASGGIFSGY